MDKAIYLPQEGTIFIFGETTVEYEGPSHETAPFKRIPESNGQKEWPEEPDGD